MNRALTCNQYDIVEISITNANSINGCGAFCIKWHKWCVHYKKWNQIISILIEMVNLKEIKCAQTWKWTQILVWPMGMRSLTKIAIWLLFRSHLECYWSMPSNVTYTYKIESRWLTFSHFGKWLLLLFLLSQ